MPPMDLADVPGWFQVLDQRLFEHFLSPRAVAPAGDLVEIGAYLGKSAILMGRHLHEGERFTVCDLFGLPAEDDDNEHEIEKAYDDLTRAGFEENYLAFHAELPVIVQELSSGITEHVPSGSARFIHVDGSHLYEHVAGDVLAARKLAAPGAIIAFDDYRSAHTPGVSLALWEAVLHHGLQVIALSTQKLYGTFDVDAAPHREALAAWVSEQGDTLQSETVRLRDQEVVRLWPNELVVAAPETPAAQLAQLGRQLTRANEQLWRLGEMLRPMQERVRNVDDRTKASAERLRNLDDRSRADADRLRAVGEQLEEAGSDVRKVHRGQLAKVLDLLEEIRAEQTGVALRAYRKLRHR